MRKSRKRKSSSRKRMPLESRRKRQSRRRLDKNGMHYRIDSGWSYPSPGANLSVGTAKEMRQYGPVDAAGKCLCLPYSKRGLEAPCPNCFCYVCDAPASACELWGAPNWHCRSENRKPRESLDFVDFYLSRGAKSSVLNADVRTVISKKLHELYAKKLRELGVIGPPYAEADYFLYLWWEQMYG